MIQLKYRPDAADLSTKLNTAIIKLSAGTNNTRKFKKCISVLLTLREAIGKTNFLVKKSYDKS